MAHKLTSDAKNTGASMIVHHRGLAGTTASNCCCVNIYINNNIQGVTNSVMFGSKVMMREPGVRLVFKEGHRVKEDTLSVVEITNGKVSSSIEFGFWIMLALLLVIFLIVLKLVL